MEPDSTKRKEGVEARSLPGLGKGPEPLYWKGLESAFPRNP